MDMTLLSLAFAAGLVLGGGVVWVALRGLTRVAETRADETESRLEAMRAGLDNERVGRARAEERARQVFELTEKLEIERNRAAEIAARDAAREAAAKAQAENHAREIASLTTLREGIEKDLKALAGEALKANQSSFLEIARQVLDQHRQAASGELEQRREAIKAMLQPMAETLTKYQKGLEDIEKARAETYGSLSAELRAVAEAQAGVRAETGRLVNALRAAPKTRGRWGEQQLQNVMELSGMSPYVDFVTEQSFDRDDGRLRPDAIIRLPGGRFIVVDAKTSMAAYLDAVECVDEAEREAHLQNHARQIRTHMKQLSSKTYWDGLTVSPDFVAMFVPGDNLFSAAVERDPALFEDAVAARVLIVTPTTLVALAKAIAFGWRQETVAENARAVADLGRDLYRRLSVMGTHVAALGRGLETAVKGYNKFVGSLESQVMPQARRFQDLQVEGTAEPLPELEHLEVETREPRAGRDLLLEGAKDEHPEAMGK